MEASMNRDTVFYRANRKRFRDLEVRFCGSEICSPLHGWGPGVRPDYLIHVILTGRGVYRAGDENWRLAAGDGFLIEPQTLTFYQADAKDPWSYIWIGFNGENAPGLIRGLGLGGGRCTFHTGRGEELRSIVLEMADHRSWTQADEYYDQSLLYRFFAVLFDDIEQAAPSQRQGKNAYVRAAVEYIQSHYYLPLRVSDIAAYVSVNRSYLYTLFVRELGMTPQACLTEFRLTRAEQLLETTDLTVEAIAMSSGYQDPLVFSKAFKKRFMMTPTAWRKRARGEAGQHSD